MSNRISDLSEDEMEDMLEQVIGDSYTLVPFPESQAYMTEPWFDEEASLDVAMLAGDSAYFIPTKYVLDVEIDED